MISLYVLQQLIGMRRETYISGQGTQKAVMPKLTTSLHQDQQFTQWRLSPEKPER